MSLPRGYEEAETTGTFFAHMLGVLVAGRKAGSNGGSLFPQRLS